jgi:hypothetical protein
MRFEIEDAAAKSRFLVAAFVRALGASTAFRMQYRKALAVFQKRADNNPPSPDSTADRLRATTTSGCSSSNLGKPSEAEADRPTQTT